MQFDALVNSGACCEADRTAGPRRLTVTDVSNMMAASQWCGCGAKPGHNLMPSPQCCGLGGKAVRPMTLPGYGVGPHGLETGAVDGVPNINADYPLIWQLPDTDFNLDPMDGHLWNPPTVRHASHSYPYAPWGYAPGPQV